MDSPCTSNGSGSMGRRCRTSSTGSMGSMGSMSSMGSMGSVYDTPLSLPRRLDMHLDTFDTQLHAGVHTRCVTAILRTTNSQTQILRVEFPLELPVFLLGFHPLEIRY